MSYASCLYSTCGMPVRDGRLHRTHYDEGWERCRLSLLKEVGRIAGGGGGTYGIAAKNLSTGETVRVRSDEVFNTASVIKVLVMVELFRQAKNGTVSLVERMALADEFRVGGSGLLNEMDNGLTPTLRDLCTAMIIVSDNVATNMLVTRLGLDAVNEGAQKLGLERTRLNRLIGFAPVTSGQNEALGLTTPNEMLRLYEDLATGEVVSPEASAEMVRILSRQHYRASIPRYLPDAYDAVTGESEPTIAHKTGAVSGVRNDVALLRFSDGRQWIIAILAQELEDQRWTVENTGEMTIGHIARAIYDTWITKV